MGTQVPEKKEIPAKHRKERELRKKMQKMTKQNKI